MIERDYKETFAPPAGLRVLDDLKKSTRAMVANVPTDNNPLLMAFREGQRSVMIHIYHKLNKDLSKPRQERAIND